MTPDYFLCDICAKETKRHLMLPVAREMSAAGDSETHFENVDLCDGCLAGMVMYYFLKASNHSGQDMEKCAAFVAEVRATAKRTRQDAEVRAMLRRPK